MSNSDAGDSPGADPPSGPIRDVPVDWKALEDAFENNAPEVHSYLHLTTGEVLRVVDGVADPQMHVRIASDGNYLRIDPVSSREQYRWGRDSSRWTKTRTCRESSVNTWTG